MATELSHKAAREDYFILLHLLHTVFCFVFFEANLSCRFQRAPIVYFSDCPTWRLRQSSF